jgi:hypothetical protein
MICSRNIREVMGSVANSQEVNTKTRHGRDSHHAWSLCRSGNRCFITWWAERLEADWNYVLFITLRLLANQKGPVCTNDASSNENIPGFGTEPDLKIT